MANLATSVLLIAAGLAPSAALGQGSMTLAVRGPQPHFVAAWAPEKEREAERAAVLARRVSLELADVSLDVALKTLTNQAGLRLIYSQAVLPAGKRVTISAGDIAVVTAMTEMLFRSGLDVVVDQDGALALVVCRHPQSEAEAPDSGSIAGRVTDKATGAPIAGATVVLEGTRRSATTDTEGRYRIGDLESGVYTLRARYIGYAPLLASAEVSRGEATKLDLALDRSAQKLDELVTTGTVVATEVRALPSPITVITARDVERQHAQTINDVFRQAVPTAVAFEFASSPAATDLSVRGTSTLAGGGQIKIFVDGVETAGFGTMPVDPNSIERVEVVRGPQAATIYGSDAAGGVMQIFTKRGDPSLTRPQVQTRGEFGVLQTPYEGSRTAWRQNYTGSISGGSSDLSYNFGAGYARLGDWLPDGELSRQSTPSVYGAMRFSRGVVTADLSGRYYVTNNGTPQNPLLLQSGFFLVSKPSYTSQQFTNQTYGARLSVSPTPWWEHQLTIGVDQRSLDQRQQRPRFTTPTDTLLVVGLSTARKTSIGYSTSLRARLGAELTGSITSGVDHYNFPASNTFTLSALNTEGTIRTEPPGDLTTSRTSIDHTGYFSQLQVGFREALFLTAGLRADRNSTFGKDAGTAVSPRVGLAHARSTRFGSLKIRGSWGRAIRAPSPGQSFGAATPTQVTLANPGLSPERQRGWDAGLDLDLGAFAFGVTWFDQVAEDLILLVTTAVDPVLTSRFENIGRVTNKGVEVEGELEVGALKLRGQYGYVRSRIDDLGPVTQVDLRTGDRPVGVPAHTAGASLMIAARRGTELGAGVTYVGPYRQTDAIALFRCFGETGPCPADFNFLVDYPGFVKINAAITQQVTSHASAVLSVDNLTNSEAYEVGNAFPVMGRMTSLAFQFRY